MEPRSRGGPRVLRVETGDEGGLSLLTSTTKTSYLQLTTCSDLREGNSKSIFKDM